MSTGKVGADDFLEAGGRVEDLPRTDPPEPHCTDLGNNELFVRAYGADLRFVFVWKKFMLYRGKRWAKDAGDGVRERAKLVPRLIYQEAAAATDPSRRKTLGRWAITSEAEPRQRAMVTLAQSSLAVPPETFDRDPWLFNVDNGTLHLQLGELRPHRRADFLTKLCPIVYDPAAQCPCFEAFLRKIFAENALLIAWLQKLLGSVLVGKSIEQILVILYGTGANGKTTLLKLLLRVLGEDYAVQAPIATFLTKHGDPISNDLARLAGTRCVVSSESPADRRFDEAVVKQLTGGDRITARFLHQEFFSFDPTFTIIVSTNHRPIIRGTDHAIWRRIRLVPTDVVIPEAEQDKDYLDRVLMPEAPGILAWLVRGCQRWQQEGLGSVPAAVKDATDEYRRESDVLGPFLEERCTMNPADPFILETAKALYDAYRRYADATGEKHLISNIEFGRRLAEKGLEKGQNSHGTRIWRGIALRPSG